MLWFYSMDLGGNASVTDVGNTQAMCRNFRFWLNVLSYSFVRVVCSHCRPNSAQFLHDVEEPHNETGNMI